MTAEQVKSLKLGIAPINDYSVLLTESALHWVKDNTTLDFDYNKDEDLANLPAPVKLFVLRYFDIMSTSGGVASESIEGLSQSFVSDKTAALWQYAEELLAEWIKPRIRFVPAQRKWQ